MYPEFKYVDMLDFGGAWTLPDAEDVPIGQGALQSNNVEFINGQVSTRKGFGQALKGVQGGVPSLMTGMHNWLFGAGNYLIYWRTDGAYYTNIINTPTSTTSLFSASGQAGTAVSAGPRTIITSFASDQTSVIPGRIAGFQTGVYCDTLFAPPKTYAGSWSNVGSGLVTPGKHYLGYLLEYRSGFITRPCPDSGVFDPTSRTFTPSSITATGGAVLNFSFDTTGWDPSIAYIWAIMTPANNSTDFRIVPGSRTPIPSPGYTGVIVVNITDDDLLATGQDATQYQFLWTQGVSTGHPFYPTAVVSLGDRMGYVTKLLTSDKSSTYSALVVSDRNNHQSITADQHLVQLPGQQDITTAFSLSDGAHYIVGPHWTYSTSDNNQVPVQWPSPRVVDGRRGTQAIRGVDVSATGENAWVADTDGLYLFAGKYADLPISYLQTPDWKRINWAQASKIVVKDHSSKKKVYVLAPLDGATNPSHLLCWDYTNGKTPTTVKYSLQQINYYAMGSIAVVRNDLANQTDGNKKQMELWVSGSTDVPVLREMSDTDTSPYRDFNWTGLATVNGDSASGQKVIHATSTNLAQLYAGMQLRIGDGTVRAETITIASVSVGSSTITATTNLVSSHTAVQADSIDLLGVPISGYYQTALFPGKEAQNGVMTFHGFHARVRGSGAHVPIIKSLDSTSSVSLISQSLTTSPNKELRWLADLRSEMASVIFQDLVLDDYFILSSLRMYFTPWITTR